MSSEEEDLNLKMLMEQSIPFHTQSGLLRDIFSQWFNRKELTDRQKQTFVFELNRLQAITWKHALMCECGKHEIIFLTIRLLKDIPTFTGQNNIQYSLRKGNVVRLPLANAVTLVIRKYADFKITTALELVEHHSPPHIIPYSETTQQEMP